jgi:hypothetical protein
MENPNLDYDVAPPGLLGCRPDGAGMRVWFCIIVSIRMPPRWGWVVCLVEFSGMMAPRWGWDAGVVCIIVSIRMPPRRGWVVCLVEFSRMMAPRWGWVAGVVCMINSIRMPPR